MTYEKIVELVSKKVSNTSIKDISEPIAVEVNVYGEGEGAFYIEAKNGKISVEPYEYYDHNVKVTIEAEELIKIANGEKTLEESIKESTATVAGAEDIALKLMKFKKKPSTKKEKTPAKTKAKSAAKKTVKAEKKIVESAKKANSKVAKDIKK